MNPSFRERGFSMLEVLLAATIFIGLMGGILIIFGAFTEKTELLLQDSDLRRRVRQVEELLRKDIERAVPTAELEFYAERDGVPGPYFVPEPFADYGRDGIPNQAEPGYDPTFFFGPKTCNPAYNPDPHGDDSAARWQQYNAAQVGAANQCIPVFGRIPNVPSNVPPTNFDKPLNPTPADLLIYDYSEGNGILDPGEWLQDINGDGKYTGEPFVDDARDQFGILHDGTGNPPGAGNLTDWRNPLSPTPNSNRRWDFEPTLVQDPGNPGNFVFPREVFTDIDGDGIFSPADAALDDWRLFRNDPTPPEDNPLTHNVDETMRMVDGTGAVRAGAQNPSFGSTNNPALFWDLFTRAYVPLSPFGFLDLNVVDGASNTSDGIFSAEDMLLYDYFGGIVNNGDQDTLYLRTFVEVGNQLVPANVYWRLIFNNTNRNYSEQFDDIGALMLQGGGTFGAGDGIWQIGEPFTDTNGNGICDPIVDPGEIRLQRIVSYPGNPAALIQDLGAAVRFNVEYFDVASGRYVAPFSDTGMDGLYDGQELRFRRGCGACTDPEGDNYLPGTNPQGTEGNGILDTANSIGLPPGSHNWNPYLLGAPAASQSTPATAFPFDSGLPAALSPIGENPFVGIKRFGYPETAGILVSTSCFNIRPFDGRDQIPPLPVRHHIALEAFGGNKLIFPGFIQGCDPNFNQAGVACATTCATNPLAARANLRCLEAPDGAMYRFSPVGIFDEEGWLRCTGVPGGFSFLRPGDEIFLWAFSIPAETSSFNEGNYNVLVPVPPGHYRIIAIKGSRLLVDLSTVPGGSPTPSQLRGTPCIFRAGYVPPAIRIDFALSNESRLIGGKVPDFLRNRDRHIWTLQGRAVRNAGLATQGIDLDSSILGTVVVCSPRGKE